MKSGGSEREDVLDLARGEALKLTEGGVESMLPKSFEEVGSA